MQKSFWPQLWARLGSETPAFFKKIKVFGGSVSALGIGLSTIPGVPDKITSVSGDLIWVGAVMVLVSSLVVKDPEVLEKKKP